MIKQSVEKPQAPEAAEDSDSEESSCSVSTAKSTNKEAVHASLLRHGSFRAATLSEPVHAEPVTFGPEHSMRCSICHQAVTLQTMEICKFEGCLATLCSRLGCQREHASKCKSKSSELPALESLPEPTDDASLEAVGGASPAGGEASARPREDVAQELTRAC